MAARFLRRRTEGSADMEFFKSRALEMGFSAAAPLDPAKLEPEAFVRDMCAADRCHAYGRNWTCPPACGTLEECGRRLRRCRRGLLVQTTGRLSGVFDARGVTETENCHLARFQAFSDWVRQLEPEALCLGAGGCRLCGTCAYPEPCRFPERACSPMEAYGLFVTRVCRECGVPYYYGEGTITYTSCVLLP